MMMIPLYTIRCGFLVVQSYESRLVPGSRRSALSTIGSAPPHDDDDDDDDGDEYSWFLVS